MWWRLFLDWRALNNYPLAEKEKKLSLFYLALFQSVIISGFLGTDAWSLASKSLTEKQDLNAFLRKSATFFKVSESDSVYGSVLQWSTRSVFARGVWKRIPTSVRTLWGRNASGVLFQHACVKADCFSERNTDMMKRTTFLRNAWFNKLPQPNVHYLLNN